MVAISTVPPANDFYVLPAAAEHISVKKARFLPKMTDFPSTERLQLPSADAATGAYAGEVDLDLGNLLACASRGPDADALAADATAACLSHGRDVVQRLVVRVASLLGSFSAEKKRTAAGGSRVSPRPDRASLTPPACRAALLRTRCSACPPPRTRAPCLGASCRCRPPPPGCPEASLCPRRARRRGGRHTRRRRGS